MISPVSGFAQDKKVSTIEQLGECYGPWRGIRTNHVISASGSFFDDLGSSRGLSTPEDLALMLHLRKTCDLLIVDAATARAENYRKPAFGHLAIVSKSGNFSRISATGQAKGVTLFSPQLATESKQQESEHVIISADAPFHSLLRWAKDQGMKALLLEAGPTLTEICFAQQMVAESALTITPKLSIEDLQGFRYPFNHEAKLVSVAEADNATFTLWRH